MRENYDHSKSCDGMDDCSGHNENERLAALLNEAYPHPKTDIRSSVMAQIRAESSIKKISKIQRRKRLLVRYGSLAACMAIITLVGVKTLPKYIVNENTTAADTNETVAYYAEGSEDSEEKSVSAVVKNYKTSLFASPVYGSALLEDDELDAYDDYDGEDIPEDCAISEDCARYVPTFFSERAAETDEFENYGAAIGESATEECDSEESVLEDAAEAKDERGTGAIFYRYIPVKNCEHSAVFRNSYHDIPKNLVSVVGNEEFNSWAFETVEEGRGEVNMVTFYRHFSQTDEDFAEEFRSFAEGDGAYYCDLPAVELFENGEWDKIAEYYENGGEYDKMVGNYFEYKFKTALISEIGSSKYTRYLLKNGIKCVSDWAISDIVRDFGISKERLSEIYDNVRAEVEAEYPDVALFTYDLDKITDANVNAGFENGMAIDAGYRIYE